MSTTPQVPPGPPGAAHTVPVEVDLTDAPGAVAGPVAGAVAGYAHPSPSVAIVEAMRAERGGQPFDLTASYELCRRINAAHGRTYYLATRVLPARRRPHVHALYAFARYADDLVDHLDLGWAPARRRAALEAWADGFMADLAARRSDDPVGMAVVHTVRTLGIAEQDLQDFLGSMAADLTVTRYESYDDLRGYMHGSAAVIGAMMLPVLRPMTDAARTPAMALGEAFQMTNFIRDVAEDAARGRVYLPQEDLRRFGVSDADLAGATSTPGVRELIAFEVARTREVYAGARAGWAMLPPASARCVRVAHLLYEGILDQVEASGYRVLEQRAIVPPRRRAALVAAGLTGAGPARIGHRGAAR